jgi:hypothetical protein
MQGLKRTAIQQASAASIYKACYILSLQQQSGTWASLTFASYAVVWNIRTLSWILKRPDARLGQERSQTPWDSAGSAVRTTSMALNTRFARSPGVCRQSVMAREMGKSHGAGSKPRASAERGYCRGASDKSCKGKRKQIPPGTRRHMNGCDGGREGGRKALVSLDRVSFECEGGLAMMLQR